MPWSDPALSRPQRLWPPCVATYSEFLWFLCCSHFPSNVFGIFVFWIIFFHSWVKPVFCFTVKLEDTVFYFIPHIYSSWKCLLTPQGQEPEICFYSLKILLLCNFLKAKFMLNQISLTVHVEGQTQTVLCGFLLLCFWIDFIKLSTGLLVFFSILISEKAFFLSHHLTSKDHSILNTLKWNNESIKKIKMLCAHSQGNQEYFAGQFTKSAANLRVQLESVYWVIFFFSIKSPQWPCVKPAAFPPSAVGRPDAPCSH